MNKKGIIFFSPKIIMWIVVWGLAFFGFYIIMNAIVGWIRGFIGL